jgi:transposase
MTGEDEIERLRRQNADLCRRVAELEQQLAAALARIAELEQQRPDPPSFVKPNRPPAPEPKQPRKKRAPHQNRGRHCEPPTCIQTHALDRCPECNYRLQGSSIDYRRQVIELPAPQPVEIIEHQVIKRFCPHCRRWRSPQLDLSHQVLGQGRIGVRIASLIGFLSQTLRLPIRRIQTYLDTLHCLRLSTGEIVELRHHLRRTLQSSVERLKQQARASPILHGDETSWRENGTNGYIWAFSTPGEQAVRYYEYDGSRSQQVVHRILGGQFAGHLVSDFYGSYNVYAGKHQRCWVHLLRDLHALKEQHAQDTSSVEWAQAVRALYDEAQTWLQAHSQPSQLAREEQYVSLMAQAHSLGLQHARSKQHPCQALAKRLLRHEDELFQFVLIEGLSADNNLAERSIRPLVVCRKISGGSRSEEGSKTRMALASLFETWQARKQNPFDECFKSLSQAASSLAESSLPQL